MSRFLKPAVLALTFAATLAIRIQGIERHFWLLGDQIRDWSIALGPLTRLPLVGPPTHIGGYTIGPAFYWIIWLIRIIFGPGFRISRMPAASDRRCCNLPPTPCSCMPSGSARSRSGLA